jgi:ABC-2 type transport system permease protein
MGGVIKSEFRKITTTKLWWTLLIPAAVLAFGWAFVAGKLAESIGHALRDDPAFTRLGYNFQDLSLGVFAVSRSINISTVFPMVFGALGLSSELQRRTITTSFLTAPSRVVLLSGKAITYVLWGSIYGVVICGVAILGTAAGTGGSYLPSAGGLFQLFIAGVFESVLWTLLGLGVGALLGSTTGTVVLLTLYTIIVEPILALLLHNHVAGVLPNGSADGLTGSTAGQIVVDQLQAHNNTPLVQVLGQHDWDVFLSGVRIAAGAVGAYAWWASGLIFLAWTAVLFVGGLVRNQLRDVT